MMKIDLSAYFKSQLKPLKLPPVDLPDGPTWNDRVKRAEKIAEIVVRYQEDIEEHYFDMREKCIKDILTKAPTGRIEGNFLLIEDIHFKSVSFLKPT